MNETPFPPAAREGKNWPVFQTEQELRDRKVAEGLQAAFCCLVKLMPPCPLPPLCKCPVCRLGRVVDAIMPRCSNAIIAGEDIERGDAVGIGADGRAYRVTRPQE